MGNSLHTDVTSNTAFLFKEILKMRRRQMSSGTRKRTQSPSLTVQWLYPIAQERAYQKYLFELMDVYSDISLPVLRNNGQRWVEEQRTDDIRADDFNEEFQQLIIKLLQTQGDMFDEKGKGVEGFNVGSIMARLTMLGFGILLFNGKQWEKVTKRISGQSFIPMEPWVPDAISLWAQMNFDLGKSLTDEYIKKTNFIVRDGIMEMKPWDAIMKDIRRMDKNMTRSRARLLARDQVGKLNGQLTKRRNEEAGIDMYKWLTAQDERVRASHKPLHNKICRWDKDHLYADSKQDAIVGNWKSRSAAGMYVGIPGRDVQCRCTSVPVYNDIIEEVDKELNKEAPPAVPIDPTPKPTKLPPPKPRAKPAPIVTTEKEAEKAIKAVKLDKKDTAILNSFTKEGFRKINKQVRVGKITRDIKDLDEAIIKLPIYKGNTYRGQPFHFPADETVFETFQKLLQPGKIMKFPAFSSSSMNESIAYEATGSFMDARIIYGIESKHGRYVGSLTSQKTNELEVIFPRNSKFKVIDRNERQQLHVTTLEIDLEEL